MVGRHGTALAWSLRARPSVGWIWRPGAPGRSLPLLTSLFSLGCFLKIEFEQQALSGDSLPSVVCVITGTDGNTMSWF